MSVRQASGVAFFPSAAKRLRIHCTRGPWPWDVKSISLPYFATALIIFVRWSGSKSVSGTKTRGQQSGISDISRSSEAASASRQRAKS